MSATELHMAEGWALKGKTAVDVKDTCAAFVQDHQDVPLRSEVQMMSAMGGSLRSNISRDWRKRLKSLDVPRTTLVRTRIWDIKAKPKACERPFQMPLLSPGDFLQWLFVKHRGHFDTSVLGNLSAQQTRVFWSDVNREDCAVTAYGVNDMLDDEVAMCIPMASYGDGVPVAKISDLSLKCTSLKSLFGGGMAIDHHMLMSCVPSKICIGKKPRGCWTTRPLYSHINHRLEFLAVGEHPPHDEFGAVLNYTEEERTIADGYRFLHA